MYWWRDTKRKKTRARPPLSLSLSLSSSITGCDGSATGSDYEGVCNAKENALKEKMSTIYFLIYNCKQKAQNINCGSFDEMCDGTQKKRAFIHFLIEWRGRRWKSSYDGREGDYTT